MVILLIYTFINLLSMVAMNLISYSIKTVALSRIQIII